ncbi:X8 [Macleaya cordata]|uniref:X8 n=1 Tax=Macleaya cordata TaxID=56857 RepID=A0A200QVJ4_MACCD|nr:X8 [Macleaya cordata]
MALALISPSLLLLIFITTFLQCVTSQSPQDSSSETNFNKNPNLKWNSKADNGRDDQSQKMLWCVAKNNAEDAALQTSLDWACGPGGANCGPIQLGGPCYDPDNFQSTASFAFNDYFQNNNKSEETCNFGGTAALTSLDPSHGNCKFLSSAQVVINGGFSGSAPGVAGPITDDTSDGQIGGGWWWGRGLIIFALIFAVKP